MKDNKYFKFISYAIGLLILPVILANQYYIDDMGRATSGYTNWGADGRPLSDTLMKIINFRSHLSDLFPLPLIFGSIILALILAIYTNRYFNKNNKIYAIIPLTYLLSPSTPEIMSYRFDSMPLIISISLPLLAYGYRFQQESKNILVGILCVIAIYSLYQASINLFIILAEIELLYLFSYNKNNKSCLLTLGSRIIQFIIGSVIYLKIILPKYFSGTYSPDHPGIVTNNIIAKVFSNFESYYSIVNKYFLNDRGLLIISSFIILSMMLILIITLKRQCKKWSITDVVLTIIILLTPLVVIPATIGSLLVLDNSIGGSLRAYVGISGAVLFFFMLLAFAMKEKMKFCFLIPIAAFLYITIIVYTFTNAKRAQEDYTRIIISEIKQDIGKLDYDNFITLGNFPKSPIFSNSEKNLPLVSMINTYSPEWYWTNKRFEFEGITREWPSLSTDIYQKASEERCSTIPISVSEHFNLYLVNKTLVIDFTKSCPLK